MLGVGIEETTTTTGTGTLTLTAVSQRARIADQFGLGDAVAYVVVSGNGDVEWGVGIAAAGNTLVRPTTILASIVSGTYSEGGGPISLTGTSTLRVVEHSGAVASCVPAVRTPAAAAFFNPALVCGTVGNTHSLVANRLMAIPIKAPEYPALTGVGCVVTTAVAGTCYLGVAENFIDSNGWMKPGRVLGVGSVSTDTTGIKTDTASYVPTLKPGHQYWQLVQGTSAAVIRALGANNTLNQLGLKASDATNPNYYLYADIGSAPFGGDLSGATFGITGVYYPPHMIFVS